MNNSMSQATSQTVKDLQDWLGKRKDQWWTQGTPISSSFGWIQIYEADNWHCIYCGRDLAANEDVLAESTKEHLVPKSVFRKGGPGPNVGNNVAACCPGCNGLKGQYFPPIDSPAWASRKAYIANVRDYIAAKRAERVKEYRTHVFKSRAMRIWTAANTRQQDYLPK